MSSVVVPGSIIIANTVKPVLQGVIINLMGVQIVADWIRIAEHVNVLILPQIHRHKRSLQLSHHSGIFYPGKHIQHNVSPVFMETGKPGKIALRLLVVGNDFLKKPGGKRTLPQRAKIV